MPKLDEKITADELLTVTNVTGFNYIKGYAFLMFKKDDVVQQVILGLEQDWPPAKIMGFRGIGGIQLMHKGEKEVNGTVYQRYQMRGYLVDITM
jgi:hypothetical protein